MTARRLVAALVAALTCAVALPPAAAEAKRVRVFTVGPKFDKRWVQSRDTFRDHLRGLATQVGVQRLGPADPARPVETARDLVTLPEDLGLMAAFTGQRGETARGASDLTTSIVGLLGSYATVSGYYVGKFPSLATRPFPPTRALATALTDTFVRVGVETFAEIADEQDAWLVAGVTLVRDWQVVCESKATYVAPPGAGPCDVEDPLKVATLRSPDEPSRTYAYEALDARPSTQALVFAPDGSLRAKVVKAYLTPVELPGQLDLVPGDVDGVDVVPTPVGRIGVVTSKDAWMPDVIDKLDARRADVLVQPEFFVGDTIRTTGPWAPDNLRGSGYAALLRSPSITSWAIPELVGNVFDFSADAQQAIAVEPAGRRGPVGGMVGQPAARGFVAVQPYVVPDPAELDVAARRKALGEAGEKLLPGSGVPCPAGGAPAPCENGHVEGVLSADVQVLVEPSPRKVARAKKAPAPFGASKFLTRARAPQRHVALAARGRDVWAAFEQEDRVVVSRSRDSGRTWGTPVRVDRRDGAATEWFPAIAAGAGGELHVAWQEGTRVAVARSTDGGTTFAAPEGTDGEGPQWRPAVAATGPGRAVLAWVDERTGSPSDGLPQAALRTAQVADGAVGASRRLDRTGATAPLAAEMDHAWAPALAARGDEVQAAWLDFRTYDWRVATRASKDGGATWAPEVEATKVPADVESLAQQPAAAFTGGGPLVAWADWAKDPLSATRASRLHDVVVARPGEDPAQADGDGDRYRHAFAPELAATGDGGAVVVLQRHARGDADVAVARVRPGATGVGRVGRVDDDGAAGHGAWRPAVAVSGRFAVVAWEDDRGGPAQLRVTRARVAALG